MAKKNTPDNRLKAVWQTNPPKFRGELLPPISEEEVYQMMGNIFCPGPFYFFVFDFSNQEFGYINPQIQDVLGFDPEEVNIRYFTSHIKEDDIPHMEACEQMAGHFYFNHIPTEQIKHYKTSYCFRVRKKDNSFVQILHQSLVINLDDDHNILNTLVVHSVIDQLVEGPNRKISFMCLDEGPHYMGLDPYTKLIDENASSSPLTKRETEVLGMFAEGFTDNEVAERLFISGTTLHVHRRSIRHKLNAKNTTQAVVKAIKMGWI